MTTVVSDLPAPVQEVLGAMADRKAFDVVVLDLRGQGAFTDVFVVGSGRSTRQVQAIADAVSARLRAIDARPAHVEGYDHAEWVLIDCFDLVVHIFTRSTRAAYALERLWGDAARLEIPPPPPDDTSPPDGASPTGDGAPGPDPGPTGQGD